jgi:hypothetical protein
VSHLRPSQWRWVLGGAMLRVSGPQDTWWKVLLEQAWQLPAELAGIDAHLDDEGRIPQRRSSDHVLPGQLGQHLGHRLARHPQPRPHLTLTRQPQDLRWTLTCPRYSVLNGSTER